MQEKMKNILSIKFELNVKNYNFSPTKTIIKILNTQITHHKWHFKLIKWQLIYLLPFFFKTCLTSPWFFIPRILEIYPFLDNVNPLHAEIIIRITVQYDYFQLLNKRVNPYLSIDVFSLQLSFPVADLQPNLSWMDFKICRK